MMLTYKQKEESATLYMRSHNLSFGSAMADERAKEMFIDALGEREQMYEHTISEFKKAWIDLLRITWEKMDSVNK